MFSMPLSTLLFTPLFLLRLLFGAALLLLFGLLPGAQAQVTTPGQWGVTPTGAFTYDIPLRLPTGIAGVAPKPSLRYSSQQGNGILGMGWTLTGLGIITRCPQTQAIDGVQGTIQINAQDRLCLDGQRLILKSGTYGAEGAEYQLQTHNGSRIFGTDLDSSDPNRRFKVHTKAGEVWEYQPISTLAGTQALHFALSRVIDHKGNYWQVFYQTNTALGEAYPRALCYTGNLRTAQPPTQCLEIGYGTAADPFGSPQARPDRSQGYLAGHKQTLQQRITGLRTRINATINPITRSASEGYTNDWQLSGTLVTDYRLQYRQSAISGRSLLASTQECGADGACMAPVQLGWHDTAEPKGWTAIPYHAPANHTSTYSVSDAEGTYFQEKATAFYLDLNGDGLKDFVSNGYTFINTGSGWQHNPSWPFPTTHQTLSNGLNDLGVRTIDLNADGLPDVVGKGQRLEGLSGDNPFLNVVETNLLNQNGTAWQTTPQYAMPVGIAQYVQGSAMDGGVRFLDLNGDGRTDFIRYIPNAADGNSQSQAYLNTPNGWVSTPNFAPPHPTSLGPYGADSGLRFADLNNDGLVDLLIYQTLIEGPAQKAAYLNTGSGWVLAPQFILPVSINVEGANDYTGIRFLDLNGDGLTDFMHRRANQAGQGAYLNTGNGWVAAPQFNPPVALSGWQNGLNVVLIDVNTDGLLDIVYNSGARDHVDRAAYLNTGSGWQLDMAYAPPDATGPEGIVQFADVWAGDGQAEMQYRSVGGYNGSHRLPTSRDLLSRIQSHDNGFVALPAIRYNTHAMLQKQGRAAPRAAAIYPQQAFVPTIPLVDLVQHNTPQNTPNTTRYNYGPALVDARAGGRGPLGFGWQEHSTQMADGSPSTTERSTYSQDWPCLGFVTQQQTKLPNGQLIRQTDNGLRVHAASQANQTCTASGLDALSFHPYPQTTTTRQWDVTATHQQGPELPRTQLTTQVDAHGNVLSQTSTTLNPDGSPTGFSTTTQHTYDPNPERQRQGRIVRTQVTHTQP